MSDENVFNKTAIANSVIDKLKFYCLLNNHMYKNMQNLIYPLHNKKNGNMLSNA